MTVRAINAEMVRELLPMDRCIELMGEAMTAGVAEGAVQPVRTGLASGPTGALGLMPGFLPAPARLGVKVVTVYPGNHGGPLGSHQGMVLLFDAASGAPTAIVEARELTAVRTAAASAVATDALARGDAESLAVFGCGDQASAHLEAMMLVRAFDRVMVWGRDHAKAGAFAERQSARLGRDVVAVRSARDAAAADVICTATAAAEPFLLGAWLEGGQHLNIVGSSIPTTSEIDIEAVACSRYFVDFEPSARALAGDFLRALERGAVKEDHIKGSIGQVLTGEIEGRTDPSETTLFKSLGMVAEDLVAAEFVVAEAERRGLGQVMAW
ncbi:MAG TPA: ornithine cyclodeaminase family protein [Caulobacteraceae bacterium]|nr:ornithine cyclodeaminase family protein [Caulobacteraceae bacterium]